MVHSLKLNSRPMRRISGAPRARGVVLIVVMVMLVIIGLVSVSVMRGALSSDLVSNNVRMQTNAMQAAQIALRYCEDHLATVGAGTKTLAYNAAGNWAAAANWKDVAKITPLTETQLKSAGSSAGAGVLGKEPQCMVESGLAVGADSSVLITARGFSPDYDEDATSLKVTQGSVVWLQSTVVLGTIAAGS